MQITMRTVGEVHSLWMGGFGVELSIDEATDLRRRLDFMLHVTPQTGDLFDRTPDGCTHLELDDEQLHFIVGQCFWFLSREDAEQVFQLLNDALRSSGAT